MTTFYMPMTDENLIAFVHSIPQPFGSRDVMEEFGMSQSYCANRLAALRDRGLIRQEGHTKAWQWYVVEVDGDGAR